MSKPAFLPMIALAAVLAPAAAMSATSGEATAGPEPIAAAKTPASETLRAAVASVDQGSGTVVLRLSQDREEFFRVQDGLIFDAVRFGDPVEVSVQTISGARTIVRLLRE